MSQPTVNSLSDALMQAMAVQPGAAAPPDQSPFQMAMMPESERKNPRPGKMPTEMGGGGSGKVDYREAIKNDFRQGLTGNPQLDQHPGHVATTPEAIAIANKYNRTPYDVATDIISVRKGWMNK